MRNVSLGKKRLKQLLAAASLVASLLGGPISVSASTLLPVQILPPATGKACGPVIVPDIQAHVYGGSLDSFDVTISDPSYVAVSTIVANKAIGFNYITRWLNPDGTLKMHVDLQPMQMTKDVPIQITFVSVHPDQSGSPVTCLFRIPASIPSPVHLAGQGTGISGQTTPPGHISSPGQGSGNTSSNGSSTATSSNSPGVETAVNSLGNLCTNGGATRLWVVLLVLFAIFCIILCAQKFEINSSVRDWNIGLILAVFVALLIFWYVSSACRTGAWAPALATFITIVGLLYTMLKGDDAQEILLLKDGKR